MDLVVWALIGISAAMLILSILWIPLPGFRRFRQAVTAKMKLAFLRSYDSQKLIHKSIYLIFAGLTYLHVIGSKIIGVASPLSSFGFMALFAITLTVFLVTRIRNRFLPTIRLERVETQNGITSLVFRAPKPLRYRSGQFAFLRFRHPALRHEEHPFSFTSAPHENSIRFDVRSVGDFTGKLQLLRVGDTARLNGGFGNFRPHSTGKPLVLIGTGIGITPILSIIKDLARNDRERDVICFLSVATRSHLIEAEALREISTAMPNLRLRTLVEDESSPRFSTSFFAEEIGPARRFVYYICSSEPVRKLVIRLLRDMRVPRRQMNYEAFNLG